MGEVRSYEAPQTGRCQCGAIRYEIIQAPQMVYTCHCTDCRRMTSSALSIGCVLPEGAFCVVRGEPKAVQRIVDSGSEIIWWICPGCGSWVCASRPGATVRNLRGGTLDNTLGCAPRCTSGRATNSPGSRYRRATRFSRHNPQIWCGFLTRSGEPAQP